MTVSLTVERYLSYCHPDKAKNICTPGKTKILIILVSLFSFIYTIPIGFSHTWKQNPDMNQTVEMVTTELGDKKTDIGRHYYVVYKTWMNFIIRFIIPSTSLFTFNILLLKQVPL